MWYCLQLIPLLGTTLRRAPPYQNSETAQSFMQYMWREEFLLSLRKKDIRYFLDHHYPNDVCKVQVLQFLGEKKKKKHTHTHILSWALKGSRRVVILIHSFLISAVTGVSDHILEISEYGALFFVIT